MIVQITTWVCDICPTGLASKKLEVEPWSDPVVAPPGGANWGYIVLEGKEHLACPECMKNNFWMDGK